MDDRLPHGDLAFVEAEKAVDYLLSFDNPDAAGKAKYFVAGGFSVSDPAALVAFLLEIARTGRMTATVTSDRGTKFVVEGSGETPLGRTARVRTVWMCEAGETAPRFVTAYPLKRKR